MPEHGRLGDKAQVPIDMHGCPACPHPAIGPAITGSPDVNVNGRPALRVVIFGDPAKPGTSARGFTIRQLIDIAQLKAEPKDTEFLAADKTLGAKVFPIEDQESKLDGSVLVTRRWDQHGNTRSNGDHAAMSDALPWGVRTGSVTLSDAELADLPYFTSG